jgi:hypothetical protein
MFTVSVLTRLSWDPRKLLEGLILGNFVVRQVGNLLKLAADRLQVPCNASVTCAIGPTVEELTLSTAEIQYNRRLATLLCF